ncbi:MAG: hypothetical protein ACYS0G_03675 [Planctomycetota bacterium]|jgi:hypothetical protein
MIAPLAMLLAAAQLTGASDPFRDAALAPPTVRMYLHVEGAAELRAEIADRPIARWAKRTLAKSQLREAWERLAAGSDTDAARLFDICLGRRLTVLARGQGESTQWAALAEVDPDDSARLLGRLAPRVLGPRHKLAILELPEHELLLARSGRLLLIGPQPQPGLFYEMVPNLTTPPAESLAADPALAEASRLGRGRAGLFMRHQPPLGGWSVAVADVRGPQIKIRHAARFDHAPFGSDVTELTWDMAPIRNLEQATILTFIQPTDTGGSPLDAFVAAALGDAAMTAEMRGNLGSRQITTIADVDGRLADPPFDLLFPTFARIYEVNDVDQARAQVDGHMIRLVKQLGRLAGDEVRLVVPDPAAFEPGEPRRVEIGFLARWLFGDVPGVERMSLNWSVVGGGESLGRWCIIASHPEHLRAVAEALAGQPPPPILGRWTHGGAANGRRLAEHLRGWRDLEGLPVNPPQVETFRDTLRIVSELAEGVERCRWRLSRPAADRMRLEAEVILSPPDSVRE